MNIFKILDTIENAVFSSQRLPWPVNEWSLIHRHNFLRLIEKMRQSVPEELKQARAVSKEAQRLLGEAQQTAQEMVDRAREDARVMVEAARAERDTRLNATDIVVAARTLAEEIERAARVRADQLEGQTRQRCQEIRAQAETEAQELKQRAERLAHGTEREIDAYAVRVLSRVEEEMTRALGVIRTNKAQLQGDPLQHADTTTREMEPVRAG